MNNIIGRKRLTLREIMRDGRKGSFAEALYVLHEVSPSDDALAIHDALDFAYRLADKQNSKRLHRAFARASTISDIAEQLEQEWPGLKHLDEPMEDPYAFDLTQGGQSKCDSESH